MAEMTTKSKERRAITTIRNIVNGLGENSYVGTAMEGVLEIAEQNIEYDAAFSLKGQKELAERNERELKLKNEQQEEEIKSLNEELEDLKGRYERLADQKREQEERLMKQLQELQEEKDRYEMPEDLFDGLERMLDEVEFKAVKDMNEAAILMSEYVGETNVSPNIYDAAKRFREYRRTLTSCKKLRKELNERYSFIKG